MKPPRALRSLRAQLTLFGILAILFPLAVLLAVVFATVEETTSQGGVAVSADGGVEITEDEDVVTTRGVSPWVPATAFLLAVPAVFAVRSWSRRAVAPIAEITATANEIQAGSLDRRIALEQAPVEVQSLAESFDAMLDRLATSSRDQHRLLEDTNHELKTPLTALAVNAEVMMRATEPTLEDYRAATERTHALVQRMQATLAALVTDARARQRLTRRVDNDLVAILRRVVAQQRAIFPDREIVLAAPQEVWLGIDGSSVERAVGNLVDNALRYSPVHAPVDVRLSEDETGVHIDVTDRGDGIASRDAARVFDRYYRVPGTSGDGAGIGLALVNQVAQAYGSVSVESPVEAGRGSRFTLTLDRSRVG